MKTQEQELADAAKEHRQPICVYCKKPFDFYHMITIWLSQKKQHKSQRR